MTAATVLLLAVAGLATGAFWSPAGRPDVGRRRRHRPPAPGGRSLLDDPDRAPGGPAPGERARCSWWSPRWRCSGRRAVSGPAHGRGARHRPARCGAGEPRAGRRPRHHGMALGGRPLDVAHRGAVRRPLAVVAVASATLPAPWRLRLRLALALLVFVGLLFLGHLADVEHFLALAVAPAPGLAARRVGVGRLVGVRRGARTPGVAAGGRGRAARDRRDPGADARRARRRPARRHGVGLHGHRDRRVGGDLAAARRGPAPRAPDRLDRGPGPRGASTRCSGCS